MIPFPFNQIFMKLKGTENTFTLCQAPLGAPAATQLLDWLIAYGVKKI